MNALVCVGSLEGIKVETKGGRADNTRSTATQENDTQVSPREGVNLPDFNGYPTVFNDRGCSRGGQIAHDAAKRPRQRRVLRAI